MIKNLACLNALDAAMNQACLMLQTDCPSCGATVRAESRFCRMCGKHLTAASAPQAPHACQSSASREEIALDEVNAADRILIRTQNSEYRFSVVDPESRRGKLSGGSLGNELKDAFLAGVLVGGRNNSVSDSSSLKINSCALFYIDVETGLRRLTTSAITNLVLIKGERARRGSLR